MAEKVLIYAGTTEGRLLAQELSRAHIACDVHVATEYGQMVMPELAGVKVCVGRLDIEEMRALLKKTDRTTMRQSWMLRIRLPQKCLPTSGRVQKEVEFHICGSSGEWTMESVAYRKTKA